MTELALTGAFWVLPVVLGYVFGRATEASHFRSIIARENTLLHLPATSMKAPVAPTPVERAELVYGSVVISVDYFKRALAALRSFVGGRVAAHESLLDRARREAVLRMKESCPNAHEIVNLRLETSAISTSSTGSVASVEVVAYGTAIYFGTAPSP